MQVSEDIVFGSTNHSIARHLFCNIRTLSNSRLFRDHLWFVGTHHAQQQ